MKVAMVERSPGESLEECKANGDTSAGVLDLNIAASTVISSICKHRQSTNKSLCINNTPTGRPWPVDDSRLLLVLPLPLNKSKLQLMALAGLSPVGRMNILPCKEGGLNCCLVLLSSPVRHIWDGQQQYTLHRVVPLVSSLPYLGRWWLHPSCLFRNFSAGVGGKGSVWDGFQMLTFLLEPGLGTITTLPVTVPFVNGYKHFGGSLFVQGTLWCSSASKEKSLWKPLEMSPFQQHTCIITNLLFLLLRKDKSDSGHMN